MVDVLALANGETEIAETPDSFLSDASIPQLPLNKSSGLLL